jgi:hypothetical protein
MNIDFEGREYTLDLDDITVAQAKVIKVHRQLTLKGLSEGLNELDPDALVAVYWLMRVQSGDTGIDIDRIDFPAIKFAEAVAKAATTEQEAETPKDLAARITTFRGCSTPT